MPNAPFSPELIDYASALFAPEDAALQDLAQAAREFGMPGWEVAPDVGRLLQVLCRAVGAKRVVEFGTLAGYSALWIAAALPADGRVISLEYNPEYAAFAREQLAKSEAGSKVEVMVGTALEMLPGLEREAPFDVVFLDADKEHYAEFLEWSTCVLRPGGLLLADNVLHSSSWNGQKPSDPASDDPRVVGVREFNRRLAGDPRFTSIIIPMRDGVAAAVYLP
jgi:caffeoyl-CoA O-methyltransferase